MPTDLAAIRERHRPVSLWDGVRCLQCKQVWGEAGCDTAQVLAALGRLREAAVAVAEGRFIATDGETRDEWCFFCDAMTGHEAWCAYLALRAALAETGSAE